jgi:hypothetical protein
MNAKYVCIIIMIKTKEGPTFNHTPIFLAISKTVIVLNLTIKSNNYIIQVDTKVNFARLTVETSTHANTAIFVHLPTQDNK